MPVANNDSFISVIDNYGLQRWDSGNVTILGVAYSIWSCMYSHTCIHYTATHVKLEKVEKLAICKIDIIAVS